MTYIKLTPINASIPPMICERISFMEGLLGGRTYISINMAHISPNKPQILSNMVQISPNSAKISSNMAQIPIYSPNITKIWPKYHQI